MGIGDRIRRARAHAGFHTGASFARKIGVRVETLNRAENGHCTPSSATLLRISQEAGVRMEWLLTGEEPMAGRPEPKSLAS